MIETGKVYKKADRKKKAPVRRITVSAETAKAYEKVVNDREKREREYARHLGQDNKPR